MLLLRAPWCGVKVPRGHTTSMTVPAGQYLPRAQSKPGPAEPCSSNKGRFKLDEVLKQHVELITKTYEFKSVGSKE